MIRIGHGWDMHRLASNRKLILGGYLVKDAEMGLLGHSDADVVLHAISLALLGSLALGDLGDHFSDKDPKNKDMDSRYILDYCYKLVLQKNYHINNLDITIFSEAIKISPIRLEIRKSIAKLLSLDLSQVSVKATTYEGLDAIGNNQAMACECSLIINGGTEMKLL